MGNCTIVPVDRTWTTWNGVECGFKGYDVTVPTAMGSHTRSVEHLSEAFSIVGKYDNEAEEIERRAQGIAEYLTSDGKWGRQDSFDNNLNL